LQALLNFFKDLGGDFTFRGSQVQAVKEFAHLHNGQMANLLNVFPGNFNGKAFFFQAYAFAFRARAAVHEAADPFAHHFRTGLAVAALQVGDDAFKGTVALSLVAVAFIADFDGLLPGAEKEGVLLFFGQFFPGEVQIGPAEFSH
jgi:hypothetical protein